MAPLPRPPADFFAGTPAHVMAYIEQLHAHIESLQTTVTRLEQRVAELEERLGKDATNSSTPPSATHPHAKPVRPKPTTKKKHGGQPGHQRHTRPLLPTEQCQRVVVCVPTACRACGHDLTGRDPEPLRHQVWELPKIEPQVTEYQQHRLRCSCGCSTCGPLPEGVPTGQAGPQLVAFSALLMACFRQSKRRAALFLNTIFNQPASASWLVNLQTIAASAVAPAYDELAKQLPTQAALHVDESPTKQATKKAWVWTFVATAFTFFAIRTSRAADCPKQLLGTDYAGLIHCDRAKMYLAFGRLQWCWAHLLRDFQALIDSPCRIKQRLGHDLRRPTRRMFGLWAKVRDGTLTRAAFQQQMKPLRQEIEAVLLRAKFDGRVGGWGADLYERRAHLWSFVEVEGIEPTNNAAEQALRHAVIWRKLSFGTQSASGSRFVERLLTVIETCRRQKSNTYAWLTEAIRCHFHGRPTPSLLPTP